MAEIGIAHTDVSTTAGGSNDEEVIDRLFTMFDNTGECSNHLFNAVHATHS